MVVASMKHTAPRGGLTPSDLERYLDRLGVRPPAAPTAAALGELFRAHVRRVPFENLLIQLNRPATLQTAVTVARIARGGGGYCLELNGAFGALLSALGYEVHHHEGRVWTGEPDRTDAPVNHLALTVRCVDGSWWLAELGMSDAVCEPLPLRSGRYSQGPFAYRLEAITGPAGRGWRFHHDPRGSFGGMDFYSVPARWDVIEAAHRRLSTAPDSPFTRLLSVARRDLSGADILRGRVLIRWDSAGHTHKYYDNADEWFTLLDTDLGLPLRELGAAHREALWRRVCMAHSAWEASQAAASPARQD
ncbi:MAG: rifF [Conexibacter sp.]|nr:rifF [Conexibacter sp.]